MPDNPPSVAMNGYGSVRPDAPRSVAVGYSIRPAENVVLGASAVPALNGIAVLRELERQLRETTGVINQVSRENSAVRVEPNGEPDNGFPLLPPLPEPERRHDIPHVRGKPANSTKAVEAFLDSAARRDALVRDLPGSGIQVIVYRTPMEQERGMSSEPRPLSTRKLWVFPRIINIGTTAKLQNNHGETLRIYYLASDFRVLDVFLMPQAETWAISNDAMRHVVMSASGAVIVTDFRTLFMDERVNL